MRLHDTDALCCVLLEVVKGEVAEDDEGRDDGEDAAFFYADEDGQDFVRKFTWRSSTVFAIAAGYVLYQYALLFFPYDFGGNKGVRVTDKAREAAAAAAAAEVSDHDQEAAHDDDAGSDSAEHEADDEHDEDATEEEAEAE